MKVGQSLTLAVALRTGCFKASQTSHFLSLLVQKRARTALWLQLSGIKRCEMYSWEARVELRWGWRWGLSKEQSTSQNRASMTDHDTCLDSEDNHVSNNLKLNYLLQPPSCSSEAARFNQYETVFAPDISQRWFYMVDFPSPFQSKVCPESLLHREISPNFDAGCLAAVILGSEDPAWNNPCLL